MLQAVSHEVVKILQTYINPINPSGCYVYYPLSHNEALHSAHRLYLCFPYGSHSKQRLFPQTALTSLSL
jgi:hypothetical protein